MDQFLDEVTESPNQQLLARTLMQGQEKSSYYVHSSPDSSSNNGGGGTVNSCAPSAGGNESTGSAGSQQSSPARKHHCDSQTGDGSPMSDASGGGSRHGSPFWGAGAGAGGRGSTGRKHYVRQRSRSDILSVSSSGTVSRDGRESETGSVLGTPLGESNPDSLAFSDRRSFDRTYVPAESASYLRMQQLLESGRSRASTHHAAPRSQGSLSSPEKEDGIMQRNDAFSSSVDTYQPAAHQQQQQQYPPLHMNSVTGGRHRRQGSNSSYLSVQGEVANGSPVGPNASSASETSGTITTTGTGTGTGGAASTVTFTGVPNAPVNVHNEAYVSLTEKNVNLHILRSLLTSESAATSTLGRSQRTSLRIVVTNPEEASDDIVDFTTCRVLVVDGKDSA
jgi:hypothetical protein